MVWTILVEGNFLWNLFGMLLSNKKKSEMDIMATNKAKTLFLLNSLSNWISSILVYFEESIISGKASNYSAIFLYINGIVIMITAIIAGVFTIAVMYSKQNCCKRYLVKRFINACFMNALTSWFSVWIIS